MAAMLTALTEFADNGNSRTYTLVGHTASKPFLCIQKRKIPTGAQRIVEDSVQLLSGTVDASALPISERVSVTIVIKRPIDGATVDMDAVLAAARDVFAGDELTNVVTTQEFLV